LKDPANLARVTALNLCARRWKNASLFLPLLLALKIVELGKVEQSRGSSLS